VQEGIPYLLERARITPPLASGVAKHSNLTGGGMAACGGELWVDPLDEGRVYFNGCSGRYAPRSRVELEAIEALFTSMGLAVVSFGWDNDVGRPAMVLRR
jgi:hypothetical protein